MVYNFLLVSLKDSCYYNKYKSKIISCCSYFMLKLKSCGSCYYVCCTKQIIIKLSNKVKEHFVIVSYTHTKIITPSIFYLSRPFPYSYWEQVGHCKARYHGRSRSGSFSKLFTIA